MARITTTTTTFSVIMMLLIGLQSTNGFLFRLARRQSLHGTPPPPAPVSVQDIQEMDFFERVESFRRGVNQFITNRPVCSSNAVSLLISCADQYLFVIRSFGVPSFSPNITPEKQTPEFLASVPRPSAQCCRVAIDFHSNLCACDIQTIEAFRRMMLFDPEMTEPGARYLYGEVCHGPVPYGSDCPDGNPFDKIREMEGGGRRMQLL